MSGISAFAGAVGLVLCAIALIACLNVLVMPRLGRRGAPSWQPLVSVLVPARNEAATIERSLRGLLAQSYGQVEILVLDDDSSDGTGAIVASMAAADARLRLLTGRPLPAGWLGKNWACHQLADVARGQVLLFADADVTWSPGALEAIVTEMDRNKADLLAVWPTQQAETPAERLTVPLMALVVLGFLPWPLVHHTRFASLAAANGQCLAFRRDAYRACGGHRGVRDHVLEDVALARRAKHAGQRLRLVDAHGQVRCRMYRSWREVRHGFGKNILAGYGGSVAWLGLATAFYWSLFAWPWLWLLVGLVAPGPGWPIAPLLFVGLAAGTRLLTAIASGQPAARSAVDALLMPASVLVMTIIAGQAVWWRHTGGTVWKGRHVAVGSGAEGQG